ncbi:CEPT1 [Bugula neritina]|uniref:diacylglycerol cholinephosphotransferase n=1 Tax=Bugula neritina TaxID=10212 RepID=A0A7J7JUF5_BUGNE|nr:CEPT1 [Bugula neritina]
MDVLSARQLKNLAEHKYKRDGEYTMLEPLLQPFWNWTVSKCPLWWAPNAITFIGLMINIFTSLLIVIYNPDNVQKSPSWTHFAAATGVFVYQTMDSIDGKQARRTNTASPLGELFDHGCDAVSTVVLVVASLIHCRLELEYLMLLTCGAYMAFYLAHWVTYCTGALKFGKFDVVEMQFLMIAGFLMSGVFGEEIWLMQVPMLGVALNKVLVATVVLGGIFQALPAFHTIFIKGGVGRNGSTVADTSVLFPVFPIFTVLALTVVIAKKSEPSGDIYTQYPCIYLFTFGFLFAKVACKLIVAHMCKSELPYWDSIYFGPALLFLNQYFDFFFPEKYVLFIATVYTLLNLCHYSHAVSSQICEHLGIYCFSIQKRPASAAAPTTTSGKSLSRTISTRQHAAKKATADGKKHK